MGFIERIGVPRRLSSRLWLITLPSAVVSFERRSDVPKLPGVGSRAFGAMLIAAGVGLGLVAMRQPEASLSYDGPLAPVVRKPATLAGLAGLAGVAFMLRSTALLLYSLGLAAAGGTGQMELEEPTTGTLLGRDRG